MPQATARAAANWRRVYAMPVASVYPSYIAKAEKKGRTRAEVDEIFRWLTGYSQASLEAEFAKKTSFKDFFAHAPKMNPSRFLITGVVCGVRVEEIQEPMMREIRYLDKLIDELARGKAMEKILRKYPSRARKLARGGPRLPGMSKKITNQLRAICLALPEATEREAWGDPTFRVRDKIFAMEKRGDGRVSVWLKAPEGFQHMIVGADPEVYFVPPYVGHKGWIGIRLDRRPDWPEVARMIERSYRLVAPKRLVSRLGAD